VIMCRMRGSAIGLVSLKSHRVSNASRVDLARVDARWRDRLNLDVEI